MKAALFSTVPYGGQARRDVWPAPGDPYSSEIAERSLKTALDLFAFADQAGFDWISLAEHHYMAHSLTPNPMVLAGALSQTIKRAKIAILGASLPLLNPVRVAEEFAMLDNLTGGRVIAGLLRGTSNEYVTYNINPAESRDRFAEAIQLVRHAWTQTQPFGWQGRYYQFRSVSVWPRPVQQPHPPIYMSGVSPESGELAARNRVGLGLAFTNLQIGAKAAAYYRAQAAEAGWTPAPEQVLYRVLVHVAETDAQANDDMMSLGGGKRTPVSMTNRSVESAVADSGYYGRDTSLREEKLTTHTLQERVELGQLVVGGPDTAFAQIKRIREVLGAGVIDITLPPLPTEKSRRAIELIGDKVLPRMHAL